MDTDRGKINNPIRDTMWQRCFWVVAEEALAKKQDEIKLDEVDAVVIEMSKLQVKDLIEILQSDKPLKRLRGE
jgi:hypothetical protein